jgi:hypothetical protein
MSTSSAGETGSGEVVHASGGLEIDTSGVEQAINKVIGLGDKLEQSFDDTGKAVDAMAATIQEALRETAAGINGVTLAQTKSSEALQRANDELEVVYKKGSAAAARASEDAIAATMQQAAAEAKTAQELRDAYQRTAQEQIAARRAVAEASQQADAQMRSSAQADVAQRTQLEAQGVAERGQLLGQEVAADREAAAQTRDLFQQNEQAQIKARQAAVTAGIEASAAEATAARAEAEKQKQIAADAAEERLRIEAQATQQRIEALGQESAAERAAAQKSRDLFQQAEQQQIQTRQAAATAAIEAEAKTRAALLVDIVAVAKAREKADAEATASFKRMSNERMLQAMHEKAVEAGGSSGGGGGGGGSSVLGGSFGGNIASGIAGGFGLTAGVGGQLAQTLGAVATLDLGQIIAQVIQLGKATVDSAVAGEKLATNFQRQMAGGVKLAGSWANLTQEVNAYIEAAGGAVDQTEALSSVIRLNALGFANSTKEVSDFVTAARGISIAMGRDIQSVSEDIALAIGNVSTRRLDQLGLSITEVNKRVEELRRSNADLSHQEAFQQAILSLSTQKFGDLARSAEAQASPVEKAAAHWRDFGLVMGQLVKPQVDAVAKSLDEATVKATELARHQLKLQMQDQQAPSVPGGVNFGSGGGPGSVNELIGLSNMAQQGVDRANQERREGVLSAQQIAADMKTASDHAQAISISLAAGRAAIMLATHDLPQGAPDITAPTKKMPSKLDTLEKEQPQIFADWVQSGNEIARKAMQESTDEQMQYEEQKAKIERDFDQQLLEQEADFNRQRQREEEAFRDQISRIERDAQQRDEKARRDLDQTIQRENRDFGRQQSKWQRDLGKSIGDNNKKEKEDEKKENDDYNERKSKSNEDYNKRIADLNEKYADDRAKAIQDHNDNLADAAAHLDAAAVYEEQRRFSKETQERDQAHNKDLQDEKDHLAEINAEDLKSHNERIKDLKDANNERNKAERESYQTRVDDAKEALDQQISDQQDALAQQLSDAAAADAQRLQDMNTAFDNEKKQRDLDYGLQLDREKGHHTDEINELDIQHNNRMDQIATQAGAEKDLLDTEFTKRLAQEGVQSAKQAKAQAVFQDTSIAIFEKYWAGIQGVMTGNPPGESTGTPSDFSAQIGVLSGEFQELLTALNNASDPDQISSINRQLDALYNALSLLDPAKYPPGGRGGTASVSSVNMSDIVTPASVGRAGLAGMGGGTSVTMGDITIVLGDIGHRSNDEIKTLVGEAMVEWVGKAASPQSRSRW